jgi:4-hydroxybenzoate polyprenyltransferase
LYGELVYGGHLLALGTASIAASAAYVLGRTPTWDLLLMAYLFSFGGYTVNRISDFEEDKISHPDRTAYLSGRKRVLPAVALVCFGVGYVLALLRNLPFFLGLLLPLILAVTYSVASDRMARVLGISRLKEGLFVKNIVVSFGWSLIPVLVGLYFLDIPLAVLAFCPFIFLRLMANTIFFDARDIAADIEYGVKTIPASLGIGKSWRLMDVIDVASGAYVVALALGGVLPTAAGFLVLFTPYSFAYRHYSLRTSAHSNSLRDLVADGEYLLWGFVTYIGHL